MAEHDDNKETDNHEDEFNINESAAVAAGTSGAESDSLFEDLDVFDEIDPEYDLSLSDEIVVEPAPDDHDDAFERRDESGSIGIDIGGSASHVGGSIEFLKEDNEPQPEKRSKPKKSAAQAAAGFLLPLSPLFDGFYDISYLLGIQTFRFGKRIFSRFFRLLIKPARYLFAIMRVMFLAVDRLFFKSVHAVHEEAVYFRKEVRSSIKYLRLAFKKDPVSVFSILFHYINKTFTSHKDMFKTAFNLAMPVAALVVFWLTVNYWGSVTYALEVTYNNRTIGFIQDESVYVKAQALAVDRLGSPDTADTPAKKRFDKPKYQLALVKLNELSDETAICDSLIENPVNSLTNACGIYIDDEFICSVKNETDATSVFESILAPYRKKGSTAIAAFVEDVKLTQGFYEDGDKMWEAARLDEVLGSKKQGAKYYTAGDDDTDWDIARKFGLTLKQFDALNPDRGKYVHAGDKYIVSNAVSFLRVKLIKTETRRVEIGYETIKTGNAKLFKGDTRTIRKGVKGQDEITELVTYIDGAVVGIPKKIAIRHLSEPVDAKVEYGTKSTTVYSNNGSYDVSVSREGFVWPVPSCHSISSYYGYRWGRFHYAIDIAGSGTNGKIVVASKDGYVEYAGWESGGGGNTVVINHGGGVKTKYCHLLGGSISVGYGQRVSAGQAIARVGSTGNATGPHLHFEVIANGYRRNPLDFV